MPLYIAQSGYLDRCHACLTDRLTHSLTQLLIKYKSGALVTQWWKRQRQPILHFATSGSLKRFSNGQPIWGKARAPANSWCQSACQCWLPTWLRLIFSNKTSVGLTNLQKIENSSSAQEKIFLAGTTLLTIKIMIYCKKIFKIWNKRIMRKRILK